MPKEKDIKKERGEVSRRDFLIGSGAVVVGAAVGAGITYPLVKGKGEGEVVTTTKISTVPTTVTSTKTEGAETVTVTSTTQIGEGETVTKTVTDTTTVSDGGVEPWQEPETTHYCRLEFH